MLIIEEIEGYNPAYLQEVISILDRCKIHTIINHAFLEDAEDFTADTAYFGCTFNTQEQADKFLRSLSFPGTSGLAVPRTIYAPKDAGQYFFSIRDYGFSEQVEKDIVFKSNKAGSICGWYNKHKNILWMADLFHIEEARGGDTEKTYIRDLSSALSKTIFSSLLIYLKTGRLPRVPLTIGADPEFEILSINNEIVNATELFNYPKASDEIGADGAGNPGELRPKYAYSPLRLARNIKRLIRKLKYMPGFEKEFRIFAGGGTRLRVGGHIHFGTRNFPDTLRKALWKLVAAPVLKFQGELRNGDTDKCREEGRDVVRDQDHGTEWRPLPSFVVSEELTKCILCTAYSVVKSCINDELPVDITTSRISKGLYHRIPLYQEYKLYIDKFVEIFVSPKENLILESRDILKEWKFPLYRNNYNLVVDCKHGWIRKYFTPLRINTNCEIRILIDFIPTNVISVFNFGEKSFFKIANFALDHFIEVRHYSSFHDVEDAVLKRRVIRPPNIGVILPVTWEKEIYSESIFRKLKDIIKEAVLELNPK